MSSKQYSYVDAFVIILEFLPEHTIAGIHILLSNGNSCLYGVNFDSNERSLYSSQFLTD